MEKEEEEASSAGEDKERQQPKEKEKDDSDDEGEEETDDETDDEDYGPSPAAGIWAGSQKLQAETEKIANPDEDDNHDQQPATKKQRQE